MDFPSDILLYRVNPERKERRFYRLRILRSLFGEPQLMREWGRIGQPGRILFETFRYPDQAEMAFCVLARQKLRRGYRRIFAHSPHAKAEPSRFRPGSRAFDIIEDPLSSILLSESAGPAHERLVSGYAASPDAR
ncbi:WGR domain-containing protein [Leisingera sp. XS_AS12]|uniref:WGR domain-containing protein n=1 Tax=Leisingera sp. XS_AS12 TaxID=3241294 RepID=UPI00351495EC